MNHLSNFKLVLLQTLLLLACAANANAEGMFSSLFGDSGKSEAVAPDPKARPAWIDNPGNGVSASAGMNVRGRAAQEEMAIMRGREEFAKRFGVSIESAQGFSPTVANDRASTTGAHVAREETKQTDVKALVKAKWRDEEADVLWVWVVPSN